MKTPRHLLRIAAFAISILVGAIGSLTFGQTITPVDGEDWAFPAGANVAPHPYSGFFRGSSGQSNPGGMVKHLQVKLTWKALQPTASTYDFSSVVNALNAAVAGNYMVVFRVECSVRCEGNIYTNGVGNQQTVPQWLVTSAPLDPGHTFLTHDKPAYDGDGTLRYVAPWHPQFKAGYRNLILALTNPNDPLARVDGVPFIVHPNCLGFYIHGVSGSRGEEMTNASDYWENNGLGPATTSATSVAGGNYSSLGAAVKSFLYARVDAWAEALDPVARYSQWGDYRHKVAYLGNGQWSLTSYNATEGALYGQYARDHGFGERTGQIEQYFDAGSQPPNNGQTYNGGYIETTWTDPVAGALRDGRIYASENEENWYYEPGFENQAAHNLSVTNSNGYGIPGKMRDLVYRTPFFRAAQLGMNFLWAGPWHVRYAAWDDPDEATFPTTSSMTAHQAALDAKLFTKSSMPLWYTLVVGKGPAISPDAACWLREANVTIGGVVSPWKNMERFVMQRDIAGAMTLSAEYQDMPKIDLKPSTEYKEWMARSTNCGASQRNIAFKLDPAFRGSLGTQDIQIKVHFRDKLTTTWKLLAARGGGTALSLGTVTNTNTNKWRTATFTLTAANMPFNPGGPGAPLGDGIDFAINVPSGTNDVIVRYVRVVRTQPVVEQAAFEATPAAISASSGDSAVVVNDNDPHISQGNFLRYDANAVNDFVTFAVPVPATGTYDIVAGLNNNTTRGIYQLAIDNGDGSGFLNQGGAVDLYTSAITYPTLDFGNKTLTAGTRQFRFTAVGKNASSSDYKLGLDTIALNPVTAVPQAVVLGNGALIANGDTIPGSADDTDFGSTDVATGTILKTYTIQNTGGATLTVSGTAATGDFAVSAAPPASIAAGATGNFTVAFNPTVAGLRTGTVSFATNDSVNNPYSFSVQGTGTSFATIDNDANSLVVSASSGEPTAVVSDSLTNNGNFLRFDADGLLDFITFDVPVPANNSYAVAVKFQNNNNRGIYQLAIDNGAGFVDVGTPQNLYSDTWTYPVIDYGTLALSTGTAKFRFTVTGQDDLSSGFKVGVDLIKLTPLNGVTEINVLGNGVTIVDGDSTPTTADFTDFGSADITTGTVTRTFTIQNTGTVSMSVGTVTLSGTNAADFAVTVQPAASVAAGGSTTFSVKFDPSALGARTAALSFSNGDADENPYNFSLQGTGTGTPEINVQGNATTIADGDTTPSLTDHTDFGSANVTGATVSRTYTIQNTGNDTLTVGTVTLSGTNAADFSVTTQPAASVSAGGSTTFTVQFDPSATGTRTAALSFSNNDANENPYNFSIQGTGTAPSIAFRAATSANSGASSASSLVTNKPAGVVSGDYMLAAIGWEIGSVIITPPAGWTLVRSIPDGFRMNVYSKIAGGSEPASYTWTFSASGKLAGGIVAFSGVNATTPIQVENGVSESTLTTSHSTPTIATTGSTTWLVSIFSDRNNTGSTWTPPSGTTERVDTRSTGTSGVSVAIYTVGPVAAGNKTHTATASVAEDHATMEIIALQP